MNGVLRNKFITLCVSAKGEFFSNITMIGMFARGESRAMQTVTAEGEKPMEIVVHNPANSQTTVESNNESGGEE